MKGSTVFLTIAAAAVGGTAIFFFSRPAAAKAKAHRAFAVGPACESFTVTNEEEAKSAVIAAAIAVHPSPDSSAIEALRAICAFMWPQCDWTDPPDFRVFIRGEQHLTWKDLETAIGQRTVAEVKTIAEKFGGMQGESQPLPWPFVWGFGTGGCFSCLGSGGQRSSNRSYRYYYPGWYSKRGSAMAGTGGAYQARPHVSYMAGTGERKRRRR